MEHNPGSLNVLPLKQSQYRIITQPSEKSSNGDTLIIEEKDKTESSNLHRHRKATATPFAAQHAAGRLTDNTSSLEAHIKKRDEYVGQFMNI